MTEIDIAVQASATPAFHLIKMAEDVANEAASAQLIAA
ncbi:hypothetical protein FHW83_005122 [Duganella sp. SG902]|nr:hypothetical protein [Duganella sp. SG902]